MRTILYGGAFDPPHLGHAAVARSVLEQTQAERLVIVPSGVRLDKAYKASEIHRSRILELFERSLSDSRISLDTDFLNPKNDLGNTTTLKMDAHYSRKFGHRPFQIFGADVVPNMKIWDPSGRVEREVPKILVIRNGEIPNVSGLVNFLLLEANLPPEYCGLSSTEIRNRVITGNYEGLDEKIAEYIRRTGTYGGSE
jgi:nicotinate-nucleotide adenylyltransferase